MVRFSQTLSNYLKVSVGHDTYNLAKYNKTKITDRTIIKYPNTGSFLLPHWKFLYNDKNNNGKIQNFSKSTKTTSPTGDSGATTLPPIGTAFMYIETTGGNKRSGVFASFERSDIIQISNITIYYNRFSISENNFRSMGRFRIQLLLDDDIWETQYTIAKNEGYSASSTEWTLLNLDFTKKNFGIKLIYDKIDTSHADMCFSDITITHHIY